MLATTSTPSDCTTTDSTTSKSIGLVHQQDNQLESLLDQTDRYLLLQNQVKNQLKNAFWELTRAKYGNLERMRSGIDGWRNGKVRIATGDGGFGLTRTDEPSLRSQELESQDAVKHTMRQESDKEPRQGMRRRNVGGKTIDSQVDKENSCDEETQEGTQTNNENTQKSNKSTMKHTFIPQSLRTAQTSFQQLLPTLVELANTQQSIVRLMGEMRCNESSCSAPGDVLEQE